MNTRKITLSYLMLACMHELYTTNVLLTHTNHNRSRARKATQTTQKKRTSISQMNDAELNEMLTNSIAKKNYTAALKYIERLLIIEQDPVKIADLLFLMGSIYFEEKDFTKTVIVFDDFTKRFKAHDSVEVAFHKAILASFYTTLDSEHDQTQTRATIARANAYLDPINNFHAFTQEVEVIRNDCLKKLAAHELHVCDTMIKYHKNRTGAQIRLAHMQQELLPLVPEMEPQLIALQEKVGAKVPIPYELPTTTHTQIIVAQK